MTRFDFAGSGSLSIRPGGQCSRQVTDPPDIGAPSSRLPTGSLTTVLLLEDEPALRHLLSRALLVAGFRVLEGGNGREALLLAQANPGAVGMVVTDIDMPLMDGIEFAQAFRRLAPGVPILFTSGKADRYSAGDLAGCDRLTKPFGPSQFVSVVHRMLGEGAHDRRA
jgi:DNA-binding response OmpR family regulator